MEWEREKTKVQVKTDSVLMHHPHASIFYIHTCMAKPDDIGFSLSVEKPLPILQKMPTLGRCCRTSLTCILHDRLNMVLAS